MKEGYIGFMMVKPAKIIELIADGDDDIFFYDSTREKNTFSSDSHIFLTKDNPSGLIVLESLPLKHSEFTVLMGVPLTINNNTLVVSNRMQPNDISGSDKQTQFIRMTLKMTENYFKVSMYKLLKTWTFMKPTDVGTVKYLFDKSISEDLRMNIMDEVCFDWDSADEMSDNVGMYFQ